MTRDGKPAMLVETKVSDASLDKNLLYFKDTLEVDLAFQVVLEGDYMSQAAPGAFVIDVARFMTFMV